MFVYVHYVEIVLYCIYVCVFPIYPSMACVLRMSTYILGTSRKRSRLCPFQWDHSADGSRLPRLACTFTSLYSSFLSLSLSLSLPLSLSLSFILSCVLSIVMSVHRLLFEFPKVFMICMASKYVKSVGMNNYLILGCTG